MDIPAASSKRLRNSEDEFDKSALSHSTKYGESMIGADESLLSSHSIVAETNKDKLKSTASTRSSSSTPSQMPQKKKCVLEVFPWLNEVENLTQKCLGSITEVKCKPVLNAMDFLMRKLTEDYPKYCKSPRLSNILARYLREFLYTYRHLYKGFEHGKDFFRRITKILAVYTDLELCGSMSGMEWDTEMANRIQLIYRIHLEFAENFTILDVFINMKRLSRMHRGVLTLLLKHFLVKITVKEPVEVDDDVFVKYLIVFKKWLAIEEISEDKEDIRSAFLTQAKPSKTFCMNSKYAPFLPADETNTFSANHYVRMLDKKFSLQPLLQALEVSEKVPGMHEPSTSGTNRKTNEVVVLSDDEDELQLVNVKVEPSETSDNNANEISDNNADEPSDFIDLTDEAFEDADVPRHYISWLTDLIQRAKIKPTTMNQRLEAAEISNDVIVIDDPSEQIDVTKKVTDESQVNKIAPISVATVSTNVTHINTPNNTDTACVLSNREEVGIHWNSNIDKGTELCPSSIDVVHTDVAQPDNQFYQHDQTSHGSVINNSNDDNSMECNAFKVSSSDGNRVMPFNVASNSISSCSDEAAEQLLTHALKNQKLTDLPSDLIDKRHMIKDSTSNRSINKVIEPSDVDCTVESTSYIEPTSSDSLPQQCNIPGSSTNYRRIQILNDKNLTVSFDKKHDEVTRNEESVSGHGSDTSDENFAKALRSQAKKSITVVHPTRHKQIQSVEHEISVEYPQDMTSSSSQTHFDSTIPLISIKPNSIFSKSPDVKAIVSPQPSERSNRSVQNLIADLTDNNQQVVVNSVAGTASTRRRVELKPDLQIDNENIPSTIMERKTYIKKTCNKTTSTGNRSVASKPQAQLNQPSSSTSSSSPSSSTTTALLSSSIDSRPQSTATATTVVMSQPISEHPHPQPHISPSKTTQTQHQPYKLFYSGTEIELGLNDIGSPLSECASPGSNPLQSLTSAFCESDNNLNHNTNVTMKLNGPSASLPSAIVHPLGIELNSKHATKYNVQKAAADRAALIETLSGTSAAFISSDERSSVEDQIDSCDNLTTTSSNSEGESDVKYKPEYMLQIYKELGNHLKTMGYKPESEAKTKTRTKRLMNAASRFLEAEDHSSTNYSPEPNDENDGEGDASLPFKKRRKLPVFSDTLQLIKEEESDSQPPFESPGSVPSVQCEIEIGSTSLPSPPTTNLSTSVGTSMSMNEEAQPITHMEHVSYPPTPMLSIANIVEYLPVRAYSTFKTPAPEIAPVRFNILPQQAMVINNASTPNVLGTANTAVPSASGATRPSKNQHVEFETTFNLIPSQQNMGGNQTNTMSGTTPQNVVNNNNMNCGIVAADNEQYLAPSMQTIATDNTANGFNVAQYHQTFHSNSPYAATYSIQPTHTTPNSLPTNFDIQNMFNLRNYQMNPQHYHNLLQNSRINFQEKKSILLNEFVNNINDGSQEHSTQNNQQQQQQQQQHHHQSQTHQNVIPAQVDGKTTTAPSINKPMAPRTKAARKMVAENVTVAAISTNDKLSTTKSNRVTRSSIRTTRAQNCNTEQKSPRRKTNRHR